jgi:DNA topoisomerase-2
VSIAGTAVKILKSYQENSNDEDVEFILTLETEYYHEARTFPLEFEKKFKLAKSTTLSNMVAFDTKGLLRRFGCIGGIMEMFYVRRLQGYVDRKASELARLDAEITELDARVRFVRAVVTGTLVVSNAADEALLAGLKAHDLPALSGENTDLRGYEYLLRMRVDRLKASSVLELEKDLASLREARDTLAAKSPEDLWLTDLDNFSAAYEAAAAVKAAARKATTAAAVAAAAKAAVKKAVKAPAKPKAKVAVPT